MQIVQELCKRPGLNKCGFDMPTIYISNPNKVRPPIPSCTVLPPGVRCYLPSISFQPSRCVNQIEDVCKTIEKTITQTVQTTLNTLGRDCQRLTESIESKLREDE